MIVLKISTTIQHQHFDRTEPLLLNAKRPLSRIRSISRSTKESIHSTVILIYFFLEVEGFQNGMNEEGIFERLIVYVVRIVNFRTFNQGRFILHINTIVFLSQG